MGQEQAQFKCKRQRAEATLLVPNALSTFTAIEPNRAACERIKNWNFKLWESGARRATWHVIFLRRLDQLSFFFVCHF